jgi:hypothetical protein
MDDLVVGDDGQYIWTPTRAPTPKSVDAGFEWTLGDDGR